MKAFIIQNGEINDASEIVTKQSGTFGTVCEDCEIKGRNSLVGHAFRNYTCGICGNARKSHCTHVPKHCCPECSMRRLECQECGKNLSVK